MPANPFQRLAATFKQAFAQHPTSYRWPQDDLLDTIHWLRQASALLIGIVWGVVPLTGWVGFVAFLAVGTLAIFAWYRRQGIDEDDYGGHQPLLAEGLAPCVSVFLLTWISVYSTLHF